MWYHQGYEPHELVLSSTTDLLHVDDALPQSNAVDDDDVKFQSCTTAVYLSVLLCSILC